MRCSNYSDQQLIQTASTNLTFHEAYYFLKYGLQIEYEDRNIMKVTCRVDFTVFQFQSRRKRDSQKDFIENRPTKKTHLIDF